MQTTENGQKGYSVVTILTVDGQFYYIFVTYFTVAALVCANC